MGIGPLRLRVISSFRLRTLNPKPCSSGHQSCDKEILDYSVATRATRRVAVALLGVSETTEYLIWGPYNKDPTIKGTIFGSPIFGIPYFLLNPKPKSPKFRTESHEPPSIAAAQVPPGRQRQPKPKNCTPGT